ncbi:Rhs family protein [Aquitalea magnusonii]|uniref:Rhs family protein n=1 Tax=Aquitalea magnusonii TaxID=332411 RepID=A0A3G9GLU9_9NEIS|nr:RHS repeat-associated core domain-containing protein [Aquitalea magnusonii]BBF86236.1 Rhs family protein [Aquitalea magnusonii]
MLAFETQDDAAVHYLFEPGSFIPLAQVHTDAIQGVKVPAWSQHNPYDPDRDPLLQAGPEPSAPRAVYYYHADHLGTPQALTDAQCQLALEMDYQAWGEAREVIAEVAASAGIRNPFRFQGQYHDDESGLHYNRHRYYDPEIGRFISRDPIGLMGGLNVHNYVDSPATKIDPLGLMPWKWNPNGMGHHLVWRKKAASCGLGHLATERDTPTYFPNPYTAGDHEVLHRAQGPYVGGRQGAWTGSQDELLEASAKGLDGMTMRGDLKIPSTGEVLAHNVTPSEAYKKLMEWHAKQIKRNCSK